MSTLSDAEREMAQLLVTVLNLESVGPDDIVPEAPLFGGEVGLGLDSIDALEIALGVQEKYGVELRADEEIFGSLRALSAYVQSHRAT